LAIFLLFAELNGLISRRTGLEVVVKEVTPDILRQNGVLSGILAALASFTHPFQLAGGSRMKGLARDMKGAIAVHDVHAYMYYLDAKLGNPSGNFP